MNTPMVTDDDIGHAKLAAFWEQWGSWVIVGMVMILVGTAGGIGLRSYLDQAAMEGSNQYDQAVKLTSEDANRDNGVEALQRITVQGDDTYKLLSHLRLMSLAAKAGEVASVRTHAEEAAKLTNDAALMARLTIEQALTYLGDEPEKGLSLLKGVEPGFEDGYLNLTKGWLLSAAGKRDEALLAFSDARLKVNSGLTNLIDASEAAARAKQGVQQ